MGDFIFLWVPDYTDALEVSLTPFPWPESLQRVLAVSSGPAGNTRLACVVLAEPLEVTVWEAAEDPCVTSLWGLHESRPPLACMSKQGLLPAAGGRGLVHSALERRIQTCCLPRLWVSQV